MKTILFIVLGTASFALHAQLYPSQCKKPDSDPNNMAGMRGLMIGAPALAVYQACLGQERAIRNEQRQDRLLQMQQPAAPPAPALQVPAPRAPAASFATSKATAEEAEYAARLAYAEQQRLRAESERLRAENAALRAKLAAPRP